MVGEGKSRAEKTKESRKRRNIVNMKKLALLGGALLLVAALVIMGSHLGAVTAVAEDRVE